MSEAEMGGGVESREPLANRERTNRDSDEQDRENWHNTGIENNNQRHREIDAKEGDHARTRKKTTAWCE